jgi:hypothetical protein
MVCAQTLGKNKAHYFVNLAALAVEVKASRFAWFCKCWESIVNESSLFFGLMSYYLL